MTLPAGASIRACGSNSDVIRLLPPPARALALAMLALLLAWAAPAAAQPIGTGSGQFTFAGWAGPALPVYYHRPAGLERDAPIVIVMHGTNRDADRYRDEWAPVAERGRFTVVAPQFSREDFPGSRGYNLGNIRGGDGSAVPEPEWSFSAIEPLFDHVVRALGSPRRTYYLYGHSAGSQFVHRYLYWKPDARVEIAFPANAGWYTLPDLEPAYPYGLAGTDRSAAHLRRALARRVVVLLGDRDLLRDRNLRTTPEALAQGPHRFARGQHFFAAAQRAACRLGTPFGWRISTVPGAGHQNRLMAAGTLPFIR